MLRRLRNRCLVRPTDIAPSRDDWEVVGVFNPGATTAGDRVVLLVRVAERPRPERPGWTGLPRWHDGELVVDWLPDDQLEWVDPRVVRLPNGCVRLTFTSHLRVLDSRDGWSIDRQRVVRIIPGGPFEEYGVEDPRITPLDGRYYITYVAASRHGAATALAVTEDFQQFERLGIIFPPENKDVVLFPRRVNQRYGALHRPTPRTRFAEPEMWFASSADLVEWGRHRWLIGGVAPWESGRIGGGTPPIPVAGGWLEIYHASQRAERPGQVGTYSAGAMLLDSDDPSVIVARTAEPIMTPETSFEREGFVPNVVFPTAVIERAGRLQVFYGAADTAIGVVEWDLDELLDRLRRDARDQRVE
jgi:predicted GH43/DUF377 family glycosyl hydrolase